MYQEENLIYQVFLVHLPQRFVRILTQGDQTSREQLFIRSSVKESE